jgi:indole-3-glycerol phosphate synthase
MSKRDILAEIVDHKRREIVTAKQRCREEDWETQARRLPAPLDFLSALTNCRRIAVIAEIKKASPSAGVIRPDFDPIAIAQSYAEGGAQCLSVLTDEKYFQGSLQYLEQVASQVALPILRKDFILDECQIFEAKIAGASAVLLIAECLSPAELKRLVALTRELQMTALVELYDEANVDAVLESGARLIGVNNRNLRTFVTDIQHTLDLLERFPSDRVVVSESGIREPADVRAILVGEAFMRAADPGRELRRLVEDQ